MFNVTERAKTRLKELLEAESDDRSVGLRLGKTASGALGVFPDRERSDDEVVEHEGTDYEDGGPGPGLVIRRG